MDTAAVNAGYAFTKWRYKSRRGIFPSVRGPADEELFSMDGTESPVITLEVLDHTAKGTGERWFVGEEAVEQSLTLSRPESPNWIYTDEYHMLWHAALSEMTTQFRPVALHVVTGLPVAYYRRQRDDLAKWLTQLHLVKRVGRRSLQQFRIEQATVIPELLGILFSLCITPDGELVENRISSGRVGVLDVGGHTTGFLVTHQLRPQRRQSTSIDTGCWKAVDRAGKEIDNRYPGLNLRDHEIIDCMIFRQVGWRGHTYDITGIVEDALKPVWEEIKSTISRIWNQRLDLVVVGGGGAHLVAKAVRELYPEAEKYAPWYVQVLGDQESMLPELAALGGQIDPVFGNCEGMYRYGRWLERGG